MSLYWTAVTLGSSKHRGSIPVSHQAAPGLNLVAPLVNLPYFQKRSAQRKKDVAKKKWTAPKKLQKSWSFQPLPLSQIFFHQFFSWNHFDTIWKQLSYCEDFQSISNLSKSLKNLAWIQFTLKSNPKKFCATSKVETKPVLNS